MNKKSTDITDELLAKFIDGRTDRAETERILSAMKEDDSLAEMLEVITGADAGMREWSRPRRAFLPMSRLAAANDKRTCSWDCETYILDRRSVSYDSWNLLRQAKINKWLFNDGTPLFNVGRVLEAGGFSVNRTYDATLEHVRKALRQGADVIAVVDNNVLNGAGSEAMPAYHAIVIEAVAEGENPEISYYDPAGPSRHKTIAAERLDAAWNPVRRYLVTASTDGGYNPVPIDVSDVELMDDLKELTEAIAENAHNVWARARLDEGWRYGAERNDSKKTHPDLVEYVRLPESEKQYDRIMAQNTLRLIMSMGFDIVDSRDTVECPCCGKQCRVEDIFCSECGKRIKLC